MRWVEISASVETTAVSKVTAIMEKFGQGGAAVEEWESEDDGIKRFVIKVYLPNTRNLKFTEKKIINEITSLNLKVELAKRFIQPEDWFESIKLHFDTKEIGEHFIVKPSWVKGDVPGSDRITLVLDPGSAFGTGLHPTTRLCLGRLEKQLKPGMKVFDLGTGTGILSIAAAKLGAEVYAVDIDSVSVSAAINNARINDVSDAVTVRRGTLSLARERALRKSRDVVVANISSKVISALAERIASILKPGGRTICSGINSQGLDEILISLSVAGLIPVAIECDDGWYALIAQKP